MVAGIVAGGFGAAIYSLFCTEDAPIFWGVWYSLGILAVAFLGRAAGGRALRW